MSSKWKPSSCEASLSCMWLNLLTACWQCVSHTMEWGVGIDLYVSLEFWMLFHTQSQGVDLYADRLMACSHRRHRRDKTVLSCLQLCSQCQLDKTRQFCHISSCVHTTDADSSKLGRDEIKLSCWRCERNWRPDKTVLFRRVGDVNKPLCAGVYSVLLLSKFGSKIFTSHVFKHHWHCVNMCSVLSWSDVLQVALLLL